MSELPETTLSSEDAEIKPANKEEALHTIKDDIEQPVQPEQKIQHVPESALSNLLDDELKQIKSLQSFKDVNGLAKSYIHLNGLLGKKFDDLTPDELDSYYSKLGRPESGDHYRLPEIPANPDLLDWYKNKAYDLGLNQTQARNLLDSYSELEQLKLKEYQDQHNEIADGWITEIKKDFGTAFDKRLEIAKKAVVTFGGSELKDYLNQSGLGNHPAMVRAFAKIGKELLEDRLTDTDARTQFGLTPHEALQKVAVLKRDPKFMTAYSSGSNVGHAAAVKEIQDLYQIAYPVE